MLSWCCCCCSTEIGTETGTGVTVGAIGSITPENGSINVESDDDDGGSWPVRLDNPKVGSAF